MTERQALLFSVVIPLFNKAAHIGETLASVASQTVDAFEVIVVDDGSTDRSVSIVEDWKDARVRLVRQANGGPGLARNRGIAEARGEWVAFIDADDLWLPNHLVTLSETIAACPSADLVATGFVRSEAIGAIAQNSEGMPRMADFFAEHSRFWTSAIAGRTAMLRREGFGAIWPGEDVELWTRLALGHAFAAHSRCTAIYVQRTGGAMDSQASARTSRSIESQPLFSTIAAALNQNMLADRHAAIARFRNALMLEYARPSLVNGQVVLAKSYLRALHENGGESPLLYRFLAHLPGPFLRSAGFAYSRSRQWWRRVSSAVRSKRVDRA